MMRRLPLLLSVLAAACVVLLIAAACGDDDTDSTPTATGSPGISPETGGVEAARRYLRETGIDGRKGDLTDPRSCAEIDEEADGEFCIHESFSTYAAGLVILRIADREEQQDRVWEMRLVLQDKQWAVTEVKPFGVELE